MDRNAPGALTDTPQKGYDEIEGADRQVARQGPPALRRDAALRGDELARADGDDRRALERASRHVSAIARVGEPRRGRVGQGSSIRERKGYLDTYDHYSQLGQRAIYGHGIWLTEDELQRCHDTGTAIAHCPTSNFFLGSGCFNLKNAKKRRAAGPGRPRDRSRRRHVVLDPADAQRGVQGRAAQRQRAFAGPRVLSRDARHRAMRFISTTRSAASRRAWRPISSCSI